MKNDTMKLLESIQSNLTEDNSSNIFYNANGTHYKPGDLIVNVNSIPSDIALAYNTALGITFISRAVYLTNDTNIANEYKMEYNYLYEVEPVELKGPYNLDYSVLVCRQTLLDNPELDRNLVISNFVNAYIGKEYDKSIDEFITKSDRKEYICRVAKVIKEV